MDMACNVCTVTNLVLFVTQFCLVPTNTLPHYAQAQFWGQYRLWTISKRLSGSGHAVLEGQDFSCPATSYTMLAAAKPRVWPFALLYFIFYYICSCRSCFSGSRDSGAYLRMQRQDSLCVLRRVEKKKSIKSVGKNLCLESWKNNPEQLKIIE